MIWLIGNRGMLGSDVEAALDSSGEEFITSDIETDITDINALRNFSGGKKIGWIINCSAYTAVDNAEDEQDTAFRINSDGVKNIAVVAGELDARLIHISTDYVFDGLKDGEYLEDDKTGPNGVYGESKLKGEINIKNNYDKYFIIRTSWLYGLNGNNFVKTMLRLFNERDLVKVVNDQWGSPTSSVDLADFIVNIVKKNSDDFGIYHFSNSGRTNWYEFAVYIYHISKELKLFKSDVAIRPIMTVEFPTKAVRPANSYLSKKKVEEIFNYKVPAWEDSIERYLEKLVSEK